MKETLLSKVVVLMPQVTPVIGVKELGRLSRCESRMPQVCLWAIIILLSTTLTRAFGMDG
jgi:hypothetical protein